MKKILMVIGGIVVAMILIVMLIFGINDLTSKKLVCKSEQGNVTIYYNDSTVTGYKVTKLSYDKDQQAAYAQQVGIENYLNEFSNYFATTLSGTCVRK